MAAIELFSTPLFSDANLRAYYRLSDVNDATANALNLTNVGSASFTTGQFGNAVTLNGSSQALVKTNHIFTSAQMANFSISFWVKLNSEIGSGTYRFLEFHTHKVTASSGMGGVFDYQYNSGTRRLHFTHYLSSVATLIDYNITLGTSNWYHIVYVKSGTTTGILYVNGSQAGTNTGSGTDNGGDTGYTYDIAIGTSRDATGSWSNSLFDDWALFERVLTPTEISQIYTGDFGGGGFYHMSV